MPKLFKPRGALGDNSMERLVGFLIVIPSAQELAKGWDAEHEGSQCWKQRAMLEFETLRDHHPQSIQATGRSG
jgi:hypothetical protein